MYKLICNGRVYNSYQYLKENEFESVVVEHSSEIFGKQSIYFDVKKKIGKTNQGATIPDGYLIDFTFEKPQLYYVEIELSSHDVFGHIAPQIFKFAVSNDITKHRILTILLEEIKKDAKKEYFLNSYIKNSKYENINALLQSMIYEQEAAVIIIIDKLREDLESDDLGKALSKIKINSNVYLFETYVNGTDKIHRFIPFQDDIIESVPTEDSILDLQDCDTIVVPAQADGFQRAFIEESAWWAIRISSAMLNKIKYIAAYQVAPVSAITYYAKVASIEKYKDTNKYILTFETKAEKLANPVCLGVKTKGIAPQAPRYTTFDKLLKAKTLHDLWK